MLRDLPARGPKELGRARAVADSARCPAEDEIRPPGGLNIVLRSRMEADDEARSRQLGGKWMVVRASRAWMELCFWDTAWLGAGSRAAGPVLRART